MVEIRRRCLKTGDRIALAEFLRKKKREFGGTLNLDEIMTLVRENMDLPFKTLPDSALKSIAGSVGFGIKPRPRRPRRDRGQPRVSRGDATDARIADLQRRVIDLENQAEKDRKQLDRVVALLKDLGEDVS